MSTITIPKKEYQELLDKKLRYEYLKQLLNEDIFAPPRIRSIKKIVDELVMSGQHSRRFIASVERGLKRSRYFRP